MKLFSCMLPQREDCGVKVGDRVLWLRESPNRNESGVVKWIGLIDDEEIAGIEFDRPLRLGSGWYRNKRLFQCVRDCGGLVAVAGLILEEEFFFNPPNIQSQSTFQPNAIPKCPTDVENKLEDSLTKTPEAQVTGVDAVEVTQFQILEQTEQPMADSESPRPLNTDQVPPQAPVLQLSAPQALSRPTSAPTPIPQSPKAISIRPTSAPAQILQTLDSKTPLLNTNGDVIKDPVGPTQQPSTPQASIIPQAQTSPQALDFLPLPLNTDDDEDDFLFEEHQVPSQAPAPHLDLGQLLLLLLFYISTKIPLSLC